METALTIFSAILGSGLVSTFVTLAVQRRNQNHYSAVLQRWSEEVQLLDELEKKIRDPRINQETKHRYRALVITGQVRFREASVERLIPVSAFQDTSKMMVGAILFLTTALGVLLTLVDFYSGQTIFGEAAVIILVYGALLLVAAIALFVHGWCSETYRSHMRTIAQVILEDKPLPKQRPKKGIKYCKPGYPVTYKRLEIYSLPKGLRDIFSRFVEENKPSKVIE